jgi:hypothetical protein
MFVEERILNGVKALLAGRVNELLGGADFNIPPVEFGTYRGAAVPVISLSTCERSEKERIVLLDAYSLTITFSAAVRPDGERYCYGYAWAVVKALGENPSLDGAVNRAVPAGKKYIPPEQTGGAWAVRLSVRVTVEGEGNDY